MQSAGPRGESRRSSSAPMAAARPALSSLQAALRKAPAPAKVGSIPKQPAPAAGVKRVLSATDAKVGQPVVKRFIVASPGANGKVAAVAVAKVPAGSAGLAKPAGVSAGSVPKGPIPAIVKAKVGAPPPGVAGAPNRNPAATVAAQGGGLSQAVITQLLQGIESAPPNSQILSVVRLADAIGSNLQIDHINYFLRALKKKVIERAQKDGVKVATPKSGTATPAKTAPVAGAPPKSLMTEAPKAAVPAKAPVAKQPAPVAKVAAPQVAKVAPAAKPKLPQPAPQQPRVAPPAPASPPSDADPEVLMNVVEDIAANPVIADGELNEARLVEVLKILWDGVARKPKDWLAAWHAMAIPLDKQAAVLQKLLNLAFMQGADSERAPMVVAELVKSHKVKLRSVEEVLVAFGHNIEGILAINEEAWHAYAHFLVHIFPKPAGQGWGWSRVGWSWQSWWKFTEQCTQSLEQSRSADVICMILRLIQDREGMALESVDKWATGQIGKVIARIAELDQCDTSAAVEKLRLHGVTVNA